MIKPVCFGINIIRYTFLNELLIPALTYSIPTQSL